MYFLEKYSSEGAVTLKNQNFRQLSEGFDNFSAVSDNFSAVSDNFSETVTIPSDVSTVT